MGRGGDSPAPLDMARVYGEYRAAVTDLLTAAAAEGDLRPGVGPGHATAVVRPPGGPDPNEQNELPLTAPGPGEVRGARPPPPGNPGDNNTPPWVYILFPPPPGATRPPPGGQHLCDRTSVYIADDRTLPASGRGGRHGRICAMVVTGGIGEMRYRRGDWIRRIIVAVHR